VPDGAALEETLGYEIRVAVDALERSGDETKKTAEVISALRASGRALEHGGLHWSGWAKLTRLEPAKRLLNVMDPVARAAAAYEMHPRLHAQLRQFTELVFEAASASLEAYSNWKAQRGLVDYVDMIDRALELLEIEAIARELSQRIELLVVDEFQDTSPIQLALFMKLHQLSGRSVWVGDPKQCIFEYAGADPGLMDAVTHWVSVSGGERENLPRNYRSRPELVDFNTMLFSAAFAAHGVSPEQVATTAERPPLPELAILPAVGLWWLDGKEHLAIAEGAARLLADPASTPVVDRITSTVRPVRAGDIAVLVYSNAQAENVAAALKRRGINSVLPRVGLLKTPEGTFVTAALRYLVDERDTLASAEIDALTEFSSQSPDEWLADKVQTWTRYREQKRRGAALDGDPPPDTDDS
jgi:ATP-dependent exoDNAse (exonuclease V) beta subunit